MNFRAPHTNGAESFLVVIRPEPPGQFTAQVVGLSEIRAMANSRDEAIQRVHAQISDWISSGQLISLTVPVQNPWEKLAGHADPDAPEEQAFLAQLSRQRHEDLERTLREYDEEDRRCSSSSSTPTM